MGHCNSHEEDSDDDKKKELLDLVILEKECDPELEESLKHVPILFCLSEVEKRLLGANLEEKKYSQGKKIICEGDTGQEFYIIKEGVCRVLKYNSVKKVDEELCKLKKGDYFGEAALLKSSPRGASIQAVGMVVVWCLNRLKFQALFGENKLKIKFGKRKAISAEPFDPEKENKMENIPSGAVMKKDEEQRQLILKVVQRNVLFNKMSNEQKNQVVDHMWIKHVKKNFSVIKQGDLGDNFYIVKKGKFDIFIRHGVNTIKVAHRTTGQSFGDLALMYSNPRAATVTALEDSELWSLDRYSFRKILSVGFRDKIQEYEHALKQVPSFAILLSQERAQVAEALEEVTFPKGHDIIQEGEKGDKFFILLKGEVVATKIINKTSVEVKRYHDGDFFGERALLKKGPRGATCTTVKKSVCLYLGRRAFEMLLGPLEDIFKEKQETYTKVNKKFEVSIQSSPAMSFNPYQKMEEKEMKEEPIFVKSKPTKPKIRIDELTIIGTLGKGSFGHVQLVQDTEGKTYALKTVSKYQVVRFNQQEHIVSEKNVMVQLDHPFLVKLHATHKDKNFLYFLLEPCLGGELFSVLRAKTYFLEETAKFFAAGVTLCFEYMHSKNIIYRDLKPENLLLDHQGYLKITDFGFAKIVRERTWTLCGTPDYLAPEVVSGQGHGKGVDWWTLGILIYEMLASYPPFYDEDPMKTYAKIMQTQLSFPMHFSKSAVELIRRLLHPKATKRLGVGKNGAKGIKTNAWFNDFDWDAFFNRKIKAPIVQPIKNNFDLSNFDKYPDDEENFPPYTGDPTHPNWDQNF